MIALITLLIDTAGEAFKLISQHEIEEQKASFENANGNLNAPPMTTLAPMAGKDALLSILHKDMFCQEVNLY